MHITRTIVHLCTCTWHTCWKKYRQMQKKKSYFCNFFVGFLEILVPFINKLLLEILHPFFIRHIFLLMFLQILFSEIKIQNFDFSFKKEGYCNHIRMGQTTFIPRYLPCYNFGWRYAIYLLSTTKMLPTSPAESDLEGMFSVPLDPAVTS